jgi:hypothetical protein
MDVAPTLLASEGIAPPRGMLGRSFGAFLAGKPEPEPVRRFVFASCGLQEGSAVFGADSCLEVLFPGELVDDGLRHSWFGETLAPDMQAAVRFYRWKDEPFPPLARMAVVESASEQDGSGATFKAMWQARTLRADRLRKAQHLLQRTPTGEAEVGADEERELADLGYLGETR